MQKERKTIIIIDDNIINLTAGKNALADKYDVFTVPSGVKLFNILEKVTPDLILLDIEMPEINGYDIIKILKSREKTSQIPIIFLTAKGDTVSELEGFSLGAVDYITKPISPPLLLKRIEAHLLVEAQKKELRRYNENLLDMVREKTHTVFELQNAIIRTIAELVEFRDDITGGHIERTQRYLKILLDTLLSMDVYKEETSNWDMEFLLPSAQLHDVGKIAIKDSILQKPGKLTNDEFEEMKKHTTFGVSVIRKIKEGTTENSFLAYAETFAGSHHERWDGKGYPSGTIGADIPLQGRLMAIADVYDALTNERPYKQAYTHNESVAIIKSERGTHFDPLLVDIFLANEKAFNNIKQY